MFITKQRKTKVDQLSILSVSTMTKLKQDKSFSNLIMVLWSELYAEVKFLIKKITVNITFSLECRDH